MSSTHQGPDGTVGEEILVMEEAGEKVLPRMPKLRKTQEEGFVALVWALEKTAG
jgi:hypothetical protein